MKSINASFASSLKTVLTYALYGALYGIMKHACPYLQEFCPIWGPTWNPQHTGYQYLAQLKSRISLEAHEGKHLNPHTIAVKILQQASHIPHFNTIAIAKLGQLSTLDPTRDPGPQFHANELISCLETTQGTETTPPTPAPSICKVYKKPFQYKKEIQCSACKMFRHDIESNDVCRFTAQFCHAQRYMTNNNDKGRNNAESYAKAQNKATVKKALATYPELTNSSKTEEEKQDTIFQMASIFHSNE